MSERHEVVSWAQIELLAALYLALGALLAGSVAPRLVPERPAARAAAPAYPKAPVIVRNDSLETVAHLEYRGSRCTLRIDHRTRTWSFTC